MANAQDYNLNQSKIPSLLNNGTDKKSSSSVPVSMQLMSALSSANSTKVQNKILDELNFLRKVSESNLNVNKRLEKIFSSNSIRPNVDNNRSYTTSFLGQKFTRGNSLKQDAKDFVKGMGDPFVDTFKYIFGMNASQPAAKTLSMAGSADPTAEMLRRKNNEELSDMIAEKLAALLGNLSNGSSILPIPGGIPGGAGGKKTNPKGVIPTTEEKLPKAEPRVLPDEGKGPKISAANKPPITVTTEPTITSQEKIPPRIPSPPRIQMVEGPSMAKLPKPQGTIDILDSEKIIKSEARAGANSILNQKTSTTMEWDPAKKAYVAENAPGSFARRMYPGLQSAGNIGKAAGSGLLRVLGSPALLAAQIGLNPNELAAGKLSDNEEIQQKYSEKYGYTMEDALLAKTDLLFSKLPQDVQSKLKTEQKIYNPRTGTKTTKFTSEEIVKNKFDLIQDYASNIKDSKSKEEFIKSVTDDDVRKYIQTKNKEHSGMMAAVQKAVPGTDASTLLQSEITPTSIPSTLAQMIETQMKENESLKEKSNLKMNIPGAGNISTVTQNNIDSSKTTVMAARATPNNPDITAQRFLSAYSVLA